MNRKANEVEARYTWFVSPDGYHHPGHFTTTHDLSFIARAYCADSFLRMVAATDSYIVPGTYGSSWRVWENKNMMLRAGQPEYYPEATGLKTGTTAVAGACLVATAKHNGYHLMCIVMGSTNNVRHTIWSAIMFFPLCVFSTTAYLKLQRLTLLNLMHWLMDLGSVFFLTRVM